jgi:predicted DNA-binding protein (MmcQ/YjbR family)
MARVRFQAELTEGHKGVVYVEVPFDPEVRFGRKPYRLAGRRHGWPVRGSIAGQSFDAYVGERWGRRFVMLDAALRRAADIEVGDEVAISLQASDDARIVALAIEQSRATTQPGKARPDTISAPPVDAQPAVRRLRQICGGWPGVLETTTFGHPTFQAGKKKTFAVLDDHERPGLLCLVVKLTREEQARRLRDERFARSKFGARHGWTSMIVDDDTDWRIVPELLRSSYGQVAAKRLVAQLGDAVRSGRHVRS